MTVKILCAAQAWDKRGRKRPCRKRAIHRIAGVEYCELHAPAPGSDRKPPLPRQWQALQARLLDDAP